MRSVGLLLVAASLVACGSDATKDPQPSASTAARVDARSSATSTSSAKRDERDERDRKVRELEERAGMDAPDAEPSSSARSLGDADLDALLAGGAALSALPVRSHDRGESFDRSLPERLKPAPTRPSKSPPRCPPGDPLCSD